MRLRDHRDRAEAKSDADCSAGNGIVLRRRDLAVHSRFVDFLMYAIKAFVLVGLLALIEECAPILPPFALPVLLLLYALPATIGSMYNVVTNRFHKQGLYNENGRLSRLNRRWLAWFGGFFVLYLVSAVLFVLQSPSWDFQEWLLIWAGIVIYYAVFLAVQHACKKEYAVKYYKARAIKWSIILAALVASILYAIVAAQPPTDLQIDLHEIIQDRYLPFADSPSPFLAECEKLTTYADCLTAYGVNKLAGAFYVVSVLVKLVLGFSVFAGVFSQLGACLLYPREIKSVFQLLPVSDAETEGNLELRYIGILIILWASLSIAFVWLNCTFGEIRATNEYTAADQWIEDTSSWIILAAEKDIEDVNEKLGQVDDAEDFNERFAEKRESYVAEHTTEVLDAVNAYYDSCIDKANSFAEWYESVPASIGRAIPMFGENMVKDEFSKQVIDSIDGGSLDASYGGYLDGLKSLYGEYWSAEEIASLAPGAQMPDADGIVAMRNIPNRLQPWPSWESGDGKELLQEVLLGKGGDGESIGVKDRIVGYIEKQREKSLSLVYELPGYFFPSSG